MANETLDLFSPDKKLFLLDGMALIYRAHFALIRSPRFTSGGLCTSAVFGMLNAITDILVKHEPTHIACAFDTSEPTQRHEVFPEYKAHRDEMPEDLSNQIPLVDRLLDALNIVTIRMPGYEADDVIGTLARQAEQKGYETWMVTPDKDYHQLVTDQIHVYKPGSKGGQPEILGVDEVRKLWEVERVEQVIDVLGLMGDSSDIHPRSSRDRSQDSKEAGCRIRERRRIARQHRQAQRETKRAGRRKHRTSLYSVSVW